MPWQKLLQKLMLTLGEATMASVAMAATMVVVTTATDCIIRDIGKDLPMQSQFQKLGMAVIKAMEVIEVIEAMEGLEVMEVIVVMEATVDIKDRPGDLTDMTQSRHY